MHSFFHCATFTCYTKASSHFCHIASYLPSLDLCLALHVMDATKVIGWWVAGWFWSSATPTKIYYGKVLRTHKGVVEILSLARVFSRELNSNQSKQATLVRNVSVTQFFSTSRITGWF
jgi:hypothetical protein